LTLNPGLFGEVGCGGEVESLWLEKFNVSWEQLIIVANKRVSLQEY